MDPASGVVGARNVAVSPAWSQCPRGGGRIVGTRETRSAPARGPVDASTSSASPPTARGCFR